MNETVKLRRVGAALVMGVPKRIAEALEVEAGDYVGIEFCSGPKRLVVQKEVVNSGKTKGRGKG